MSHKVYRQEKTCLNCGAYVEKKFCPECGQENIETRENFFHLVGHFVSDYLHFDSKFFRSLIPLFTKPGFLTKEYWEGRRTQYIHPLRLFFFITIIFMVVSSLFFKKFGPEMKRRMIVPDKGLSAVDSSVWNSPDTTRIIFKNETITVAKLRELKQTDDRQFRKLNSGIDVVFTNFKYVTFFLLPIYALIFMLLQYRRRLFYVDHLVYTMHLQCFVYCAFTVMWMIPLLVPQTFEFIRSASLLAVLTYLVVSFRYLYRQSWGKTIFKSFVATFALFFITMIVIILTASVDAIFFET